jgi:hypothetical protein
MNFRFQKMRLDGTHLLVALAAEDNFHLTALHLLTLCPKSLLEGRWLYMHRKRLFAGVLRVEEAVLAGGNAALHLGDLGKRGEAVVEAGQ